MCFDLETKDGLSEGKRHVLADSTTTMEGNRYKDRGAEERKGGSMDTDLCGIGNLSAMIRYQTRKL